MSEAESRKYEAIKNDPIVTSLNIPGATPGEIISTAAGGEGPMASPASAGRSWTLPAGSDVESTALLVLRQLQAFDANIKNIYCGSEISIAASKRVADWNASVSIGVNDQRISGRISAGPGEEPDAVAQPEKTNVEDSCTASVKQLFN